MAWLPDAEKISQISLLVLMQLTKVTDTDRQTDRHRRPRLCIASRGKNDEPVLYRENWPKSTAVITGVIFTCPGRAGPGRFLLLTAAALVYFATIALRGRPIQPLYWLRFALTPPPSSTLFRNYSAPSYKATYSLRHTIYGSPYSRHFVKTNHVHIDFQSRRGWLYTNIYNQGRFYVGAGGAQAPQMLARPPKYFGSNSKNTHS